MTVIPLTPSVWRVQPSQKRSALSCRFASTRFVADCCFSDAGLLRGRGKNQAWEQGAGGSVGSTGGVGSVGSVGRGEEAFCRAVLR
ncbi:hypothetical protein [Fischerella sp. PCC 9605]|uniref:hypothetical protein n=1 Tax=Fischerella sp. PCC 9605 TaxID=1173024 RepID=UPI0004B226A7|nr:hypothetical protein [Fischerella sp. PCC 9605]